MYKKSLSAAVGAMALLGSLASAAPAQAGGSCPDPGTAKLSVLHGVPGLTVDVWVDGKEVATNTTVTGAYTKFTFDVSSVLKSGANSLAIEMYPNDPSKMLTLDDVDWNQLPPDNNTGIQFPVQLQVAGALADTNAHGVQSTAADLSSAALTV